MWRTIAASVKGASHQRSDLPNQDAYVEFCHRGPTDFSFVAVSDGHGARQHVRSQIGAGLAVKSFSTAAFTQLGFNGHVTEEFVQTILPRAILGTWHKAVAEHLLSHPLTSDDRETFEQHSSDGSFHPIVLNPALAYGATLLGAVALGDYLVFVRIGDGDILKVAKDGEVTTHNTEDDCLGSEQTNSLCMPDALDHFHVELRCIRNGAPQLIFLATDGYAKSFAENDAFGKVAVDILGMIRSNGLAFVVELLPAWLSETSQGGSGDDTTCACLANVDPTLSRVQSERVRQGDGAGDGAAPPGAPRATAEHRSNGGNGEC